MYQSQQHMLFRLRAQRWYIVIHHKWTNGRQVLHQKLDHVCHLLGSFPVPLAERIPDSKQPRCEQKHTYASWCCGYIQIIETWSVHWSSPWYGDATWTLCRSCCFFWFYVAIAKKYMLNIQICMVFYDKSVIQYDLGTSPKTNIAKGNHHF